MRGSGETGGAEKSSLYIHSANGAPYSSLGQRPRQKPKKTT